MNLLLNVTILLFFQPFLLLFLFVIFFTFLTLFVVHSFCSVMVAPGGRGLTSVLARPRNPLVLYNITLAVTQVPVPRKTPAEDRFLGMHYVAAQRPHGPLAAPGIVAAS